jgi:dienelactone hydrolase
VSDEPVQAERVRNLSPWAQWQLRLAATAVAHPVPDDPAAVTAWRSRIRGRLTDLLGRFPDPVPPDPELGEPVDCGSYTRTRVLFDAEDTMSVPAFLLAPRDRTEPGPAVLAIHGHGPGKAEVCAVDRPDATGDAPPGGDYAHRLAGAGHVVLAPDLRGFGERADWQPPDRYQCDVNLVHAFAAGYHPLTQNLHDLVVALDVLEQHPLVDPDRIGVVGFSYGATMALFLAAWDPRVRAAVVSGYLSSWLAAHRVPWNLCGSQVLPGMLGELEHAEVAALVAPRPMLVETGTDDPIFPLDAATATVADLARVYGALHAPAGALVHDVFDGDHRWHGAAAGPFLERWL